MKYAIITGASRGLGEAIAKRLINDNFSIVTVSRTKNEELEQLALEKGILYHQVTCNLSRENEIQEVFMEVAHQVFKMEPNEILLINNAGVIDPIHTVGNLDLTPTIRNIQINLIAPILITNLFLKKAPLTKALLQIVNVTSGAADYPIGGWSIYCSAKAGLNMFTKAVAEEQAEVKAPHKIIAFNPGVMDTGMQETIRFTSQEAFKDLERFKEFKDKNILKTTKEVAGALVDLLESGTVESGKVYHISELLK